MIYSLVREFSTHERWLCALQNNFLFAINEQREFFVLENNQHSRELLSRFIQKRNCFIEWGNSVGSWCHRTLGVFPAVMNMSNLERKVSYELICARMGINQIHHASNYKNNCALHAQNLLQIYTDYMKPRVDMIFTLSQNYNQNFLNTLPSMIIEKLSMLQPQYTKPCLEFYYQPPKALYFKHTVLKKLLEDVLSCPFKVIDGKITHEKLPQVLKFGTTECKFGVGGFHGFSPDICGTSLPWCRLVDWDVGSYYPSLVCFDPVLVSILGEDFVREYNHIRETRLSVKKSNPSLANGLKLILNALTGKLNDKTSRFYNPQAYIQITVTGQLYLLMVADFCISMGVPFLSLNTDGITLVDDDTLKSKTILDYISSLTKLTFEDTYYQKYYGRDVNAYFAIKDHGIKGKNIFSFERLTNKNCNGLAVNYLIKQCLLNGGKPADYIKDVPVVDFLDIGCCTATNECLRFYRSVNADGKLTFGNGRAVPNGVGCATLDQYQPAESILADLDYDYYINTAQQALDTIVPLVNRTYERLFENQSV